MIKPLGNRVLVKLAKEEDVTKSGIVLPENSGKDKKTEGEVIAVGSGKIADDGTPIRIEVKVGDKIIIKSWGGDEVEFDGVEYKIFDVADILAIIE